MSLQSEFTTIARDDGRAALATVVASEGTPEVGAKILLRVDETTDGTLGDAALDHGVPAGGEHLGNFLAGRVLAGPVCHAVRDRQHGGSPLSHATNPPIFRPASREDERR